MWCSQEWKKPVILNVCRFLQPSINTNFFNCDQEFLPQNGEWILTITDTGNLTCQILLHCQNPKFPEQLRQSKTENDAICYPLIFKIFPNLTIPGRILSVSPIINMDVVKRLTNVNRWKYSITANNSPKCRGNTTDLCQRIIHQWIHILRSIVNYHPFPNNNNMMVACFSTVLVASQYPVC